MTFYQELQLNQAGSKNLLKKSETLKEKLYHMWVYLVKIAVTMAFCFLFVTIFSILFGNENSIVGCSSFIMPYGISECGSGDPHRTIYDAFGFVLCNYDCMSAFSKSVFTGIGNAVKYCGTGCVDSVRMP